MAAIIPGKDLIAALAAAGIDVDKARRVVVDIPHDDIPTIHIERFGDERLLRVVGSLTGARIDRADGE